MVVILMILGGFLSNVITMKLFSLVHLLLFVKCVSVWACVHAGMLVLDYAITFVYYFLATSHVSLHHI